MTLRSLKRLQIILPNKPAWRASLSLAAGMLFASSLAAQEPAVYRFAGVRPISTVRQVEHNDEAAPLERLKNRSAEERWNDRVQPPRVVANPEPLPLVPDADAFQPIPESTSLPNQELPTLPDVRQLDEFDPFSGERSYDSRTIPARPIARQEPLPFKVKLPPPPAVRSLGDIMPYQDYEVKIDDVYAEETLPPGVDVNRVPNDVALDDGPLAPRLSPDTVFAWESSNLWHNPLYFEDPTLERYGHVAPQWVQPFVSMGRFGIQLVGMPYQSTIDPPRKRRYTLGWYRPGDVAPKQFHQVPLNLDAAAVQAGAVATGIAILP